MRVIALFLACLCLVAALAGCNAPDAQPEETIPSTSIDVPETTTKPAEPESTAPVTTVPPATEPETTVPVTTEPPTTEPTTTEPPTTEPKPTEPKPTEPKPTEPVIPDGEYTRAELEAMDTTKNAYGQGIHVDDKNRPYGATNAQKKYGQYDAFFIMPEDGNIYLTFDEGYENGYTSKILDVLKQKEVKSVFFVTMDYCKKNPDLVRRMIDEGHTVGNHSVKHKSMPTLDIDTMIQEVMGLHDYVLQNFGYEMHLFRPPMGEYSQQSLAVLQNLGYKTVNWSFAYYDYDPADQMAPEKAYNKVVNAAHSGGIYLLHAVSETNTEILGDVIDSLRDQDYHLECFQ